MKVSEIFEKIKETSKSTEKMLLLKKYSHNQHFKNALYYANNPFMPFHVTKVHKVSLSQRKNIIPLSEEESWQEFFLTLDKCAARKITGNAAIDALHNHFKSVSTENEFWMRKILEKNLTIGVSLKTINSVFPSFIPTFEIALAQKFEDKRILGKRNVAVEPKLDGIRCFTVVNGDSAVMFARSGKTINNFNDTILPEIIKMGDGCYDGELMGEDFTSLMRQAYRKEDKDTSGTYLALFDFLPIEEWTTKKSKLSCKERFNILTNKIKSCNINADLVKIVDRTICNSNYDEIKKYHDLYASLGYEGAMIKTLEDPYRFGRGFEVMKLKAFHDVDLEITGLLEGTGKHQGKLGSFQVIFEGVEVQVGSGLSDEVRELVWKDKESFLGRTIEVRYQEITPDGSLRFPTFVCFRNDK
jgi:DNA ligase-1